MSEITFDRSVVDEIVVSLRGEEHTLPAVKHEQHDPLASLYAVVIKLHNRVQALEEKLEGKRDE